MARALTSAYKAAATAGVIYPAWLLEFEFDEGVMRLFSGYGELLWNGETWYGSGDLLNISLAEETKDIEAKTTVFELTGAPDSVVARALSTPYSGRPCRVWNALFDSDGALISDPTRSFSGKMDTMPIFDDPEKPIIRLTAESNLVVLTAAKERRYTHEDQQIDHPGDMFFEFVVQMQDKEINWK